MFGSVLFEGTTWAEKDIEKIRNNSKEREDVENWMSRGTGGGVAGSMERMYDSMRANSYYYQLDEIYDLIDKDFTNKQILSYLQKKGAKIEDWEIDLNMYVGLPGCEHTEQAKKDFNEFANANKALIRIIDYNTDEKSLKQIQKEMEDAAVSAIKNGKTVYYDVPNINDKDRKKLLDRITAELKDTHFHCSTKYILAAKLHEKFNSLQTEQIREGIENGLSIEQVQVYANPKFDYEQMREIRRGFEHGLSMEQIQVCTKSEFDEWQMEEIIGGFYQDLSMEQVQFYADSKFSGEKMAEIRMGFKHDLSMEQIQFYADSKFDGATMQQIRMGFEQGLTMKQIETFAENKLNSWNMYLIRKGFAYGLTTEQVKMYTNLEFNNEEQVDEIITGFMNGLSMEQVQTYAKPKLNWEQMREMRCDLESHLSEATTHYKGELGEFDYSRRDYVLRNFHGHDCLQYNSEIGNTTLDLPKGITDTSWMFTGCVLPDGFKFGDFDTSKVENMNRMFENCSMPDEFTLGDGFDTSNVKDMSCMFANCSMPNNFTLGDGFDTSNVENMSCMFYGCNAPNDFVFNNKFVINDDCIVENMFEYSNIDDLSPLEEPDLEAEGEEL